jgi:hypothetical protein
VAEEASEGAVGAGEASEGAVGAPGEASEVAEASAVVVAEASGEVDMVVEERGPNEYHKTH